jgi:dihydroorotate dehydrogenase electron transfer subunit
MHKLLAKLIDAQALDSGVFVHTYHAPEISCTAQPGQFVNIRVSNSVAPLLRRPFSVLSSDGREQFRILFEVKGQGTEILSRKQPGAEVDCVGPLGQPFQIKAGKMNLVIAGGMGVAPLFFLMQQLRTKPHPTLLLYGVRTKARLYLVDELVASGVQIQIFTDDGSAGQQGMVTDFVEEYMQPGCAIYACGPMEMIKVLTYKVNAAGLECQVSLENQLGCGVGACLGCVVKVRDGYARVCCDGPVFESDSLAF